ncbi:hypothetical protein [Gynuella sunshinyii]|uniref:hypothetical protein n=1 Tax=Gynuella sunshinyii TaxID=1445505 RepID=UPI0005CC2B17|nr:hypothetical protein [Gynuella sunshinyii]
MKVISLVVASFLNIAAVGYFGLGAIDEYIDRKSGVVVEETLSDNTINHLKALSEVQMLLKSGEVTQANSKLSESVETLVYILQKNCNLPKCHEALRNYEHN